MRSTSLLARAASFAAGACLLFAMLVPAGASATTVANVPPYNSDVGTFELPISCGISVSGAVSGLHFFYLNTNVVVSGAVAASLGPNQQFNLSEGQGSITFPAWLANLAGTVNLTQAAAAIPTLDIGAENATPSVINVASSYDLSVPHIALTKGQPFTVGLPLSGTFTVGPYTAPSSGTVTLQFDEAVAIVKLENAKGATALTLQADCKPVAGNALLTIAVGGAAGQAPSLIAGANVIFPATANSVDGVINAGYSCTINGASYPLGVAVEGNIPLSVSKTGNLAITGASGALDIPANTVNQLIAAGDKTISGTVNSLQLNATNSTPASENALPITGISIPNTTLVANTPVIVPLPASGTLNPGAFTPVSGATNMVVSVGTASATLHINGSLTGTAATCATPSPAVLLANDPVA